MSNIWSKVPLQTIVNFEWNKGDIETEGKHAGNTTGITSI